MGIESAGKARMWVRTPEGDSLGQPDKPVELADKQTYPQVVILEIELTFGKISLAFERGEFNEMITRHGQDADVAALYETADEGETDE